MNSRLARHPSSRQAANGVLRILLPLALLLLFWAGAASAETGNSCIDCHSNPNFLVTDKKLYDYYQLWEQSVHGQEGVSCVDCHNGNPKAKDKTTAHGTGGMSASNRTSPVNYRNVPQTCAQCHEEFFRHFKDSKHYEISQKADPKQRSANCVTCHGSVNIAVLNVTTVRKTCELCHNEKSGNHPNIPARAEVLLNKFLSVQRYDRYLAKLQKNLKDPLSFNQIDKTATSIFIDWHTFDLDNIEKRTLKLLEQMKAKRNEIKSSLGKEG